MLYARYTELAEVPGMLYARHTELAEVSGKGIKSYITHRSSGQVKKGCTRTPGIVATGVQNLQKKFFVV